MHNKIYYFYPMINNHSILQKYFSPAHLRLAWERMIRSNGKDIKDFFGIEIYAANLDKNLGRLSEAILNGEFKPHCMSLSPMMFHIEIR